MGQEGAAALQRRGEEWETQPSHSADMGLLRPGQVYTGHKGSGGTSSNVGGRNEGGQYRAQKYSPPNPKPFMERQRLQRRSRQVLEWELELRCRGLW